MFFKTLVLCLLFNLVYSISEHPILVIVSYDAFKYNYFHTKTLPHMNRLRKLGTYADYLINVFPTKTFPNHHSISTGLYPEVHGVLGNSFFDTASNKQINISYELFHYNEKIVPIWRKNEDMGNGRYSGVMMWPGSSYAYQGKNVTHVQEYNPKIDWIKRIDTIISWIKDPSKPANLIMLYFEEPDTHGHAFGPDSDVISDQLTKLDNITEYLNQQLKVNQLSDKVNVIHLSDHGMAGVKLTNLINVTQYLSPNTYYMSGSSPILQFTPKKGFEQEIYKKLKDGSRINGHFKVYKRDEFLERWHYKNNPRSPPIIVMADVGYALDDLILAAPYYAKQYHFNLTNDHVFGVHGYDYTEESMRPIFMARGPKIRNNHKVAPFSTVDLFNLFCEVLEIESTKNNGTLANIKDILANPNGKYSLSSILIITAGGILITIILVSCAAMITLMMIKRQQSITTTAALNKRFPQTFQTSIEAQHLLEPEEAQWIQVNMIFKKISKFM